MTRPRSIRRSLLVNLVAVVVVLGVAILAVTVVGVRRAVHTLSEELIAGSIEQVEERLRRFVDPVTSGLRLGADWGREGMLDLDRPESVNALLAPMLRENWQIDAVIVADQDGREHLLRRVGEAWTCRRMRRDEWGDRSQISEWTNAEPEPVTRWVELDYDPRSRPWFEGALDRARAAVPGADARTRINWTPPYRFFTAGRPGLTASITFEAPGPDGVTHVIAFDVLLDEITVFTQSLRPSANGIAFVMTYEGLVIGLPGHELYADPEAVQAAILTQASRLELSVIRDGTEAYFREPVERRGAYPFRSDGRAWWGGARPFELGADRLLLIAVGVPESDILGNLKRMRLLMIAITVMVLGGAVWRAVRLAGRYSRPVEALVRESDRISRGDLEAGEAVERCWRSSGWPPPTITCDAACARS